MGELKFKVEVIGDIALVKPPHGAVPDLRQAKEFAVGLLGKGGVRSVWLASGPVTGPYKARSGLIYLAGEARAHTLYREYGCTFKVDLEKDFVTPRLSYEHMRVARMVKSNERVINMFAGVGIFSIIIAKYSNASIVHSIDINPDAYEKMVENIKLNRVEDRVVPYLGDAAEVIESRLKGSADRVLMPLPDLALPYFKYAIDALQDAGYVHIYLHVHAAKGEDPERVAASELVKNVGRSDISVVIDRSRVVRMVGPRFYQVVLDVEVKKS